MSGSDERPRSLMRKTKGSSLRDIALGALR
jgi:hypothetical protein